MKYKTLLVFSVFFLTACHYTPLSEKEVNDKVQTCLKKDQKPWYTFVTPGDKKSGVLFIECKDKNYPAVINKEDQSLFDNDTPISATGLPSLSGGPF